MYYNVFNHLLLHAGNNLTGRILLGVLLTCVMLTLCGFITVYVYRHRSDKSDRFPLVDDAEAVARASTSFTIVANNNNGHSASSSPEEPDFLMAAKDQPTRSHLNVEYHPISMIALDSSPTNIII